jgi:hypothetical protein
MVDRFVELEFGRNSFCLSDAEGCARSLFDEEKDPADASSFHMMEVSSADVRSVLARAIFEYAHLW